MGQSSSKPHPNQQIQELKQLYEPTSKLPHLPGQPLCIQYLFPAYQSQDSPASAKRQPFLQLYSFEMNSTSKQIIEDINIYQFRKNNLPWIVKVACFDVERKHCQCSLFSCKYTVCTQRVEFRLHSFKTTGKGFADLGNSKKYLESFTLQEGVYVLINALQGYQILAQQFKVNCPNARSIGITRQGQIKVWINQNWALNQQNLITIPDRQIIEQVLRLVEQRTKGNLCKMLGIQSGYLNFTFNQMQGLLSHFVIAFNKGKITLKERVSQASLELLDVSSSKPRKVSLKKEKQDESVKIGTMNTPTKTKNTLQTTQRRFYSHQLKKQKADIILIHNQNHSAKKETNNPFHLTNNKKQVKFNYPQANTTTYYPHSIRGNASQMINFTPSRIVEGNPKVAFRSQPVINNYNTMQQKNHSYPLFEKAISRKISDNVKTSTAATTTNFTQQHRFQDKCLSNKLNMVANTNYYFKKNILQISQSQKMNTLGSSEAIKPVKKQQISSSLKEKQEKSRGEFNPPKPIPKTVSFVTPQSILARGQILVTQQRSQQYTPGKVESINSITEQFRQLLQSDKKIQSQFFLSEQQIYDCSLLSLEKSQKHLKQHQNDCFLYQKSESEIAKPSMTKCYSIKQVDEELSYELEGNNM